MDSEELKSRVEYIVASLEDVQENPIVGGYVPPYIGGGEIKLVIIGQDPTVKNPKSRKNITSTLNLNKPKSALLRYIDGICSGLGITMENVYATNLFKYFYSASPAGTPEVLQSHLEPNLKLLKDELSDLNLSTDCLVITLGEPVLRLLLEENRVSRKEKKVRYYWDYNSTIKSSDRNFRFVNESKSALSHKFYPFCHQPSMRKQFYKDWLKDYISFVKENSFFTK